jgi:hypothetical protein
MTWYEFGGLMLMGVVWSILSWIRFIRTRSLEKPPSARRRPF